MSLPPPRVLFGRALFGIVRSSLWSYGSSTRGSQRGHRRYPGPRTCRSRDVPSRHRRVEPSGEFVESDLLCFGGRLEDGVTLLLPRLAFFVDDFGDKIE